MLEINAHLTLHAPHGGDAFEWLMTQQGLLHREVKNRRTLCIEVGGKRFFIKAHQGCGWKEILKDLFQWRLPVLSARNEWEAIEKLKQLKVRTPTLAGKGLRGWNPAHLRSFVITEALEGMISLETLVQTWDGLAAGKRKQLKASIIKDLAAISSTLHSNGINHRDLYLCHFLICDRVWSQWNPGDSLGMILIDLHRVQIRKRAPIRWVVKDLGSLLCSSLDWGVSRRDLIHFMHQYSGHRWGTMSRGERRFWRRVWKRACDLFESYYSRKPPSVS